MKLRLPHCLPPPKNCAGLSSQATSIGEREEGQGTCKDLKADELFPGNPDITPPKLPRRWGVPQAQRLPPSGKEQENGCHLPSTNWAPDPQLSLELCRKDSQWSHFSDLPLQVPQSSTWPRADTQ